MRVFYAVRSCETGGQQAHELPGAHEDGTLGLLVTSGRPLHKPYPVRPFAFFPVVETYSG